MDQVALWTAHEQMFESEREWDAPFWDVDCVPYEGPNPVYGGICGRLSICSLPSLGRRMLAFINMSYLGIPGLNYDEYCNPAACDVPLLARVVEEYRHLIVGIKVRMGAGDICSPGLEPLHRAREAADLTGLPIMIELRDVHGNRRDFDRGFRALRTFVAGRELEPRQPPGSIPWIRQVDA